MLPLYESIYIKGKVFETMQEEMKSWQAHNFPGREGWIPLMGLGEELGELQEARFDYTSEGLSDAIGDCCIYIADYCNAIEYNLQEIRNSKTETIYDLRELIINYGKLCHAHLKQTQKIRMHEDHRENSLNAIAKIMTYLNTHMNKDIETIAWETWIKVRTRDWQKNKNTAHLI